MIKKMLFNGLLLALLLTNTLQAQADAADTLARLLGEMTAFRADFTQTTLDAKGNNLQQVEGTIAVKKPGLFYWKTLPPMNQLMVSDGDQLWFYDSDLEQVTVQPLDQRITQTPALLLSGDVTKLEDSYEIAGEQNGNSWYFLLKPKDPESLFDQLKLTFLDERLVQMHLADSLGQRSSIEFIGAEINAQLDPKLFEFSPPEGVDLIMQ